MFITSNYNQNDWENVNESHILGIGVQHFWDMVFENHGSYALSNFLDSTEDFSNVTVTEWDENGQKIMKMDTVISGIPFIDSTRTEIKLQKKIKND